MGGQQGDSALPHPWCEKFSRLSLRHVEGSFFVPDPAGGTKADGSSRSCPAPSHSSRLRWRNSPSRIALKRCFRGMGSLSRTCNSPGFLRRRSRTTAPGFLPVFPGKQGFSPSGRGYNLPPVTQTCQLFRLPPRQRSGAGQRIIFQPLAPCPPPAWEGPGRIGRKHTPVGHDGAQPLPASGGENLFFFQSEGGEQGGVHHLRNRRKPLGRVSQWQTSRPPAGAKLGSAREWCGENPPSQAIV